VDLIAYNFWCLSVVILGMGLVGRVGGRTYEVTNMAFFFLLLLLSTFQSVFISSFFYFALLPSGTS
jgi:hypothetical protein